MGRVAGRWGGGGCCGSGCTGGSQASASSLSSRAQGSRPEQEAYHRSTCRPANRRPRQKARHLSEASVGWRAGVPQARRETRGRMAPQHGVNGKMGVDWAKPPGGGGGKRAGVISNSTTGSRAAVDISAITMTTWGWRGGGRVEHRGGVGAWKGREADESDSPSEQSS